jgi:hypothetical protein
MQSMNSYTQAAMERAMKVQEVDVAGDSEEDPGSAWELGDLGEPCPIISPGVLRSSEESESS